MLKGNKQSKSGKRDAEKQKNHKKSELQQQVRRETSGF